MSWREASLEWVEGASPVHLTDKLAEIVDVAESTVNSFTLNTFGETESLVAREVRRAEERLAGSSIRLSVEFPSSGESFSRYQSLYSNSLVREEAQMEDIRSIKVNVIANQITIFVFSCCHSSVVLLYCGLVSGSLEVGAVVASLLSALFEKEDWGEGEAEDPTHVMAPLGTQQPTHHTSHNDNHNYKK